MAFIFHYKNWTKIEDGEFKVTSGIYGKYIPMTQINEVVWVEKIPQMQRKNGFSWLAKEKGVFIDSLTQREVFVFVDDLRQPKIKMTYRDSLVLYLNFSDSLKTAEYMTKFSERLK